MIRDLPHVALPRGPSDPVEALQIHWTRKRAQRFFSRGIKEVLEVAHGQLAQVPVHRLAPPRPTAHLRDTRPAHDRCPAPPPCRPAAADGPVRAARPPQTSRPPCNAP